MAYQSTSYLLPQVEDATHLNEALPPMCPSRKSFTIAPIRNHPILKEYLHSPSTKVIPGLARPVPTRFTEMDPWGFGDEVIEDPYWHLSRRSSTWNTRDDRPSASESRSWESYWNLCSRFDEGLFGGQDRSEDAPHNLSRVNGSLVKGEPRGLLPSGFRTPNRSRASSPPDTRAESYDIHPQEMLEESDILEESRDYQPEEAHVENLCQHELPSEDSIDDYYRFEDSEELEDGQEAETGNGKPDSGYSSHDERPENTRQEPIEGNDQQESTSKSPVKENINPVQESMEAGPSIKKPTPILDKSPLQKLLSNLHPKSLHVTSDRICYDSRYDQPLKARVRLTTKRPLTEGSSQEFNKKIKILLNSDKKG
ncbi:hypothetical protein DFH28DRAFT_1182716 [Melampsora americana]|nr:hypothetical protein DFH28DRAFT_1182716 [Melampsora americana]